jgi:hypothetical protein
MRLAYASAIVLAFATLLTICSLSTDTKSQYWHTPHTSLYNIVYDASSALERAKNGRGDKVARLRDVTTAKAYLRSARNMATDHAISKILKIDAVKMQHDMDLTRAKINGKKKQSKKRRRRFIK